jgi:succinyl-CoA synthetase beta subunit
MLIKTMGILVDYLEAKAMADRYGIRSVESAYLDSAEAAVEFSKHKPIALKALSGNALHKTKSGLVALNLSGENEIRSAFRNLAEKASAYKPYKILGQRMVSGGLEIILGGSVDPQFGKLVLIGLGGIYVETFRDFALRICPVTRYDAESMIEQLHSKSVIAQDDKARGMLVDLILSVSRMFSDNEVSELDLNPVILHDGTYDAVDIRILR